MEGQSSLPEPLIRINNSALPVVSGISVLNFSHVPLTSCKSKCAVLPTWVLVQARFRWFWVVSFVNLSTWQNLGLSGRRNHNREKWLHRRALWVSLSVVFLFDLFLIWKCPAHWGQGCPWEGKQAKQASSTIPAWPLHQFLPQACPDIPGWWITFCERKSTLSSPYCFWSWFSSKQ